MCCGEETCSTRCRHRTVFAFAACLLVAGLAIVAVGIYQIESLHDVTRNVAALNVYLAFYANFWCGAYIAIVGLVGVVGGCCRSRCVEVAFLTLTILSAMCLALIVLVHGSFGIASLELCDLFGRNHSVICVCDVKDQVPVVVRNSSLQTFFDDPPALWKRAAHANATSSPTIVKARSEDHREYFCITNELLRSYAFQTAFAAFAVVCSIVGACVSCGLLCSCCGPKRVANANYEDSDPYVVYYDHQFSQQRPPSMQSTSSQGIYASVDETRHYVASRQ